MRSSSICVLLLAIFSIQASCSISNNFLNLVASKNGEAKIQKDDFGLYVEMDVADTPLSPEDSPKMLLSFATHKTILAGQDCASFTKHDCTNHVCTIGKTEEEVNFPFFKALANNATIEGYFDRKAFILNQTAKVYYTALACESKIAGYGKGRSGIIGMGEEDGSVKNYRLNNTDKTLFSVSLRNLTEGSLYFSSQSSLTVSKPVSLKTANSWKTESGPAYWFWADGNVTATVSVIVDLHTDAIGLPDIFFRPLLDSFKKYGVTCPDDATPSAINKPECTFTGNVTELPTLYLQVQGQNISIPKEIYLKDPVTVKQEKITFNFRELSQLHETGETYIDPLWANTIVLDSHFLTQYYTVFKQGSVEFHAKGGSSSSGFGGWKWVGIGAAVVVVAAGVFFFLKSKKSSGDEYSRN